MAANVCHSILHRAVSFADLALHRIATAMFFSGSRVSRVWVPGAAPLAMTKRLPARSMTPQPMAMRASPIVLTSEGFKADGR
jgi:hypothetical protein